MFPNWINPDFNTHGQGRPKIHQSWLIAAMACTALSMCSGGGLAAETESGKPASAKSVPDKPSVVRITEKTGHFELTRNGQPYFIKGVGGDGSRKTLVAAGGNSIRTWGADKLDATLDEAASLGLSVTVGIWLGHERHGFDYTNAEQVAEQFAKAEETILRFKEHPAVLMWGIGNEMEGYKAGDNAAIWSAVNSIAGMAKRVDPQHPTMTVIAEIGGDRVKNIHRLCPEIDVVGINSYGGVVSLPKRYREAGGRKPYIVTEFGPPGIWEVTKGPLEMVVEPSSTEKAEFYRRAYEKAIAGEKELCLVSYAFVWGSKQEATATWFGMLLPDGSRLGAADALTEMWTGKPPANRCPNVKSPALEKVGPAEQLEPGATVRATLAASDPEGDPLTVDWVLSREAESFGTGGDAEAAPPTFPKAIIKGGTTHVEVKLPDEGGGYRLFAYVRDNHGGAAVANVPLRVKGTAPLPAAKAAPLPLVLYDEAGRDGLPYAPSGWMGNNKAIRLNPASEESPHSGKTCVRVDYLEKEGWGGVVWQDPAGDWGDRPGGRDLSGAKRLSFWARGAEGGEVVTFEYGVLERDKKFHDSARGKLEKVTLTGEWQHFTLDLKGQDLKRIKTGFAWVLGATGKPVTFYLDDIRYE